MENEYRTYEDFSSEEKYQYDKLVSEHKNLEEQYTEISTKIMKMHGYEFDKNDNPSDIYNLKGEFNMIASNKDNSFTVTVSKTWKEVV